MKFLIKGTFFATSNAAKCYRCNSQDDGSVCNDPFISADVDQVSCTGACFVNFFKNIFIKDILFNNRNKNYSLNIMHVKKFKLGDGAQQVIQRDCAIPVIGCAGFDKVCDKTSGYCKCKTCSGDLCNSSKSNFDMKLKTIALFALSVLLSVVFL